MLLTYLIEVTICWTVLYSLFVIAMRKETFFNINRWYLLSSILAGLTLPLLRHLQFTPDVLDYNQELISHIPMATEFRNAPSTIVQNIQTATAYSIDYSQILITIYILITGLFLIRLIKGLLKIQQLYQSGHKVNQGNYTIVSNSEEHLPFSFFKSVFISSSVELGEDYNRVLRHELEHVRALHTIDILVIEVIQILFWFHPLVYFYKSSIRQTHEYLADQAAYGEGSRKIYGQLLLRQSLSGLESALVHQFFHSHIKKRIQMIYQKKSGRGAWLKYFLAVPTLMLLAVVFMSQTHKLKYSYEQKGVPIILYDGKQLDFETQEERKLYSEKFNSLEVWNGEIVAEKYEGLETCECTVFNHIRTPGYILRTKEIEAEIYQKGNSTWHLKYTSNIFSPLELKIVDQNFKLLRTLTFDKNRKNIEFSLDDLPIPNAPFQFQLRQGDKGLDLGMYDFTNPNAVVKYDPLKSDMSHNESANSGSNPSELNQTDLDTALLQSQFASIIENLPKTGFIKTEHRLNELYNNWLQKYPTAKRKITSTIFSSGINSDFYVKLQNDKVHIQYADEMRFDNGFNAYVAPHETVLRSSENDIYGLLSEHVVPENLREVVIQYLRFFTDYDYKNVKTVQSAFEKYCREKNIDIPFNLSELTPFTPNDIPRDLLKYKNHKWPEPKPLIWTKNTGLNLTLEEEADLSQGIKSMIYLQPKDAVEVFGDRATLGFYLLLDYSYPEDHFLLQTEKMRKEVNKIFDSYNESKSYAWSNSLKETYDSLRKKFPQVIRPSTLFFNAAHKKGLNLIFKNEHLVKVYKSLEDSHVRIDQRESDIQHQPHQSTNCSNDPDKIHVGYVVGTTIESCSDKSFDCAHDMLIKFANRIKRYPPQAVKEGYQGVVGLTLQIDSDGSYLGYKNINKVDSYPYGIQEEIERISSSINKEFKFIPGECEGTKVASQFSIVLRFKLDEDQLKEVRKVGKGDVGKVEQNLNVMTISQDFFTYQYRTNINRPYEVEVIDPNGTEVFNKNFDYIYKSIHGRVDFPNNVSGKYVLRIIQDGLVKETSFDREDANRNLSDQTDRNRESIITSEESKSQKNLDTIITYNPDTFEETITIQSRTTPIPDPYTPVSKPKIPKDQFKSDLIVQFNPITRTETVMELEYSEQLKDQVEDLEFDFELIETEKEVKLVGDHRNNPFSLVGFVNEEGKTPSYKPGRFSIHYDGSDEYRVPTSGLNKGTYYFVMSKEDISLKIRYIKE